MLSFPGHGEQRGGPDILVIIFQYEDCNRALETAKYIGH